MVASLGAGSLNPWLYEDRFFLMNSEQQSAQSGGNPQDVAGDFRAGFIRALYRGYLERDASPDEIAHYLWRLDDGETERTLIEAFANSEEALNVAAARLAGTSNVSAAAPVAERAVAPLTIRSDEVMRLINRSFVRTNGREPSFSEVDAKFEQFRQGGELADIIDIDRVPPAKLEDRAAVDTAVSLLYATALQRNASEPELETWFNHYSHVGLLSDLIVQIADSAEARDKRTSKFPSAFLVQMAYEIIFDRGAVAFEVDYWRQRLDKKEVSPTAMLLQFFNDQMQTRVWIEQGQARNNPQLAYLFGSRGVVAAEEWDNYPAPDRRQLNHSALGRGSTFAMDKTDGIAVSILTSLYKGGDYIRSFLENITSQTIFRDHCELIIVDACSPENERKVIAEFQRKFPNIVYKRCDTRVGIYEAWNIAARMARGRYCTNANLDDCRRSDSFEIQAAVLDSVPFADITYQDVLYSFEGHIPFEEIEEHDLRTALPVVSAYNLMEFNSPHNAPMWRTSLHEELGYFDEMLKSAGDYDFWLRCLIAGKTFYKANEAHAAYYVNPEGLSTRSDTRGVEEGWALGRKYYRKIVSPLLTATDEEFIAKLEAVADVPVKTVESGRRYDIIQAALRKLGSDSRSRDLRTPA